MKFDSNRAWLEAMAAIRACRSLLVPVAGVFFLIPSVATSFFLGDIQAQIMGNLDNREVLNGIVEAEFGKIMGISLFAMLAGFIGYLAVLFLLTDRSRPTVGEAILRALRFLPSLIGAVIIAYLGLVVGIMLLAIVGGILSAALEGAGASIMVVAILALVLAITVRLSLTLPVIVVEGVVNPVAALVRSWRMTRGNAMKLLGFYALLFIAYVVIAVILMVVIGAVTGVAGGTEPGEVTLILAGILSGAISAIVGVIASAVLAAVHAQLAGTSSRALDETFG